MSDLREALEALVSEWRYTGTDLTPWQEGGGPDPYETALDLAAHKVADLLAAHPVEPAVKSAREVAQGVHQRFAPLREAALGVPVAKPSQTEASAAEVDPETGFARPLLGPTVSLSVGAPPACEIGCGTCNGLPGNPGCPAGCEGTGRIRLPVCPWRADHHLMESCSCGWVTRPLLDRERLFRLLHEDGCGCDTERKSVTLADADWMRGHIAHWYDRVDAVMDLARPMPTRDQIVEAISARLHITTDLIPGGEPRHLSADTTAVYEAADAVLALLKGSD